MANFAHIENGVITGLYDQLPTNWRNISNFYTLESETDYIHSLGWRTVVKDNTPIDTNTHYKGEPSYNIVNDDVVETIPQYQIQQPDLSALHISAMVYLREKRDRLLKETDFSQLSDVVTLNGTALTQAYITYRQQLRDLPSQYENDSNFVDERTAVYPTLQTPTEGV